MESLQIGRMGCVDQKRGLIMPFKKPDWRIRQIEPIAAPTLGLAYLKALPPREAAYLLWDMAEEKRSEIFIRLLMQASFAAISYLMDEPIACAWCLAIGPNSEAGVIHMSFAPKGRSRASALARAFLRLQPFSTLLGLIPRPFHGARRLAESSGFERIAVLPKAASPLFLTNRSDGILYLWSRING